MPAAAEEALEAGAIGVSTDLYYEPAAAASTEEVIEVCRPFAGANGLYGTHVRDEADRVTDPLEETFAIGRARKLMRRALSLLPRCPDPGSGLSRV